jgi:hypothetical protein
VPANGLGGVNAGGRVMPSSCQRQADRLPIM